MIEIRPMQASDYDEVMALWKSTEGITTDRSDTRGAIEAYLSRNPGMSFVAKSGDSIVGAVLGGHDGRRGFLHHLAVTPGYRGKGTGRLLSEHVILALKKLGIMKCHLFVHAMNKPGISFWGNRGWTQRNDIELFTRTID